MLTHKCLLITTGGTIEGQVATNKVDKETVLVAENFRAVLQPSITSIKKYDIDVELDWEAVCNVDSSNILPQHWEDLSNMIKEKYDDYDSFIIAHGTNTLGYTCAALSFALANLNKPVVLTGSQVPAGMPGSDAEMNLNNALRVATMQRDRNQIKGVLAVFGSHIIAGTRVKKDTEFDYDAFKSFIVGHIGRIGRIIDIDEANLEKHTSYLSTTRYPVARTSKDLICENDFDMRIASLTEFPGMPTDIFKTLVERSNIQGFILRAFGAGDVSEKHHKSLEFLRERGVPVVVTTQAPNGNSNFQVNEPGQYLRDNNLAIPAYDMSIESQTTKLAWLLAKKNKGLLDYEQLCKLMIDNLKGEINVLWEI